MSPKVTKPLTIQSHIFGERHANCHLQFQFVNEVSNCKSILIDTSRVEPQICSVEKWEQVAFLHDLTKVLPLLLGRITTCGIMGASMQNHDRSWLSVLQGGQVRVDIQGLLAVVIVGKPFTLETKSFKHLIMIGPSGVGNIDLGRGAAA